MKRVPWATVVTVAMLSALAAGAWWWQQTIKRQPVPARKPPFNSSRKLKLSMII